MPGNDTRDLKCRLLTITEPPSRDIISVGHVMKKLQNCRTAGEAGTNDVA